jgi:branched-chain amino acid transport system ATP-binding protein
MTAESAHSVKIGVKNLILSSGAGKAPDGVSFDILDNEILAVTGPKGAGKTSLLDCITGFAQPQSGEITYNGKKISGVKPDKIVKLGIARTFQNTELLNTQTVLDNLMAARHIHTGGNFATGALYYGPAVNEETDQRRVVEDIINFLELEPFRDLTADKLSSEIRERVELGRALALEPEVLLIDEPFEGTRPEEKAAFSRLVQEIFKGQGNAYPRTAVLRDGVKCVVIFTRDAAAAKVCADRVVGINAGNIITG